jgi:hypothetical protein
MFLISAVVVFGLIGAVAFAKKKYATQEPLKEVVQNIPLEKPLSHSAAASAVKASAIQQSALQEDLPDADRISQLFALDSSKLPIVETISYTSRVPWLKDRFAWLADYASYYGTSRHFIARSLNHKPDYLTQKISPGDRFNVFKRDQNIQFYLLTDLSRCRMWFYYYDPDTNERVLLKTYRIGLGRLDSKTKSGYLTPTGKYLLGDKTAIYKPGTMGFFQDRKTEMIRVFGTRWIPFEKEEEGCTERAKGFGVHGSPWTIDPASGQLVEDRSKIGQYDSDGCIRLLSEDIEELFAIIVSRPTTIELVKDFHDAKPPGIEKGSNP